MTEVDNKLELRDFRRMTYKVFKYSTVYIKGLPFVFTEKSEEEDSHSGKYDDCKFVVKDSDKIERERKLMHLDPSGPAEIISINESSLRYLKELS